MLLTSGIRALQIALVLGCLGMLASAVSAALGSAPPDPFELPEPRPLAAVDRSLERHSIIETRDLFATHEPAPGGDVIVEEVLPPSKAEWRLIGTVAMSDPALAIATLEHKRTRGLRGAWRAGEEIEPGLTLVRVEARRVVVRRDGRHEQIPMDDDQGPLAGRGPAPSAARPGPTAAERRDAARQARIEQMADQREQQRLQELRMQAEAEAAAQAAAEAASEPVPGQGRLETLMNSLRMTPVQDENGELQDIIVEPNPDMADNPFGELAPGTRCHTLNGIPMSRMHEAIASLSDDQQACLQCTAPDGTSKTICY